MKVSSGISYFKYTTFLLILLSPLLIISQQDTLYGRFVDGVYRSAKNFTDNNPITYRDIQFEKEGQQIIYSELVKNKKITIKNSSKTEEILTDSVWGYVQNGTLYIRVQSGFYRVPVVGKICYFTAMIEVYQTAGGGIDPFTGVAVTVPLRSRELREFLAFPEESSRVYSFSLSRVEEELIKDNEVWKIYQSEKAKNRRKYITRYIRLYNQKHPLWK